MRKTSSLVLHEKDVETGATASERYLAKLARKAFLKLWSYPNPYTDENRGSELCDFMVVFGHDIIIFSDKHCEYPEISDQKTAWFRWYRRAIKKSVEQLSGASSFIKKFPNRIFIDKNCTHPLPIPLPSPDKLKIHLIAVTRGSANASKKHWGNGSSSSLMINTLIEGDEHKNHPFMIGWPLKNRKFVHVLDELTLDVLLNELDTISDFVCYLNKKEKFLTTKDVDFIISGEEDLLAYYLTNPLDNYEGFSFPPIPFTHKIATVNEGLWSVFSKSKAYSSWKHFNKISYEWDQLIESQTSHIYQNTAEVLKKNDYSLHDIQAHELVLRAMADEGRSTRQVLAEQHRSILTKISSENRLVKTIVIPNRPNRAYVLMVLKLDDGQNYEEYRELRRASLVGFCRACRLRISGLNEVIGIASEQLSHSALTQDFILMQFEKQLTQEEKEIEILALRSADIWKDNWVSL